MIVDRKSFFSTIRRSLFNGRLGVRQVDGLTAILTEWEKTSPDSDLRPLAYMLATSHHETGRSMQPIKELGGAAYFRRMYDITGERPRLARANGNTSTGDGARYAGRGFVQLTWKNNYRRAGEKLGLDLVSRPEQALKLEPAIRILFAGMSEGWFTGKKLSDYFSATRTDWFNARRIINGTDRATLIADYAKSYWTALQISARQRSTQQQQASIPLPPLPPIRPSGIRPKIRASKPVQPLQQPLPFHQMPMDPGR